MFLVKWKNDALHYKLLKEQETLLNQDSFSFSIKIMRAFLSPTLLSPGNAIQNHFQMASAPPKTDFDSGFSRFALDRIVRRPRFHQAKPFALSFQAYTVNEEVPWHIIRKEQERREEQRDPNGGRIPLYREPPPPVEPVEKKDDDKPKRGVIIIGGDNDPTVVDNSVDNTIDDFTI